MTTQVMYFIVYSPSSFIKIFFSLYHRLTVTRDFVRGILRSNNTGYILTDNVAF